jgi:hypothetical protein
VDLDLIARAEVDNALFERSGIDRIQNVHGNPLLVGAFEEAPLNIESC